MSNKKLDLECVELGYANGLAPGAPFTEDEKWAMVEEADMGILNKFPF